MKRRLSAASRHTVRPLRLRHLGPLIAFAVPSLVVGYGFVIPGSCIAGVNQLTIGFASTIGGACITYLLGIRSALRDIEEETP